MSCETVDEAVDRGVQRARQGEGPTSLEMRTYRYKGHSKSDPAKYRTKEEVEEYKAKDPIEIVKGILLDKRYADEAWLEEIMEKVKEEVADAVTVAEESPFPEPKELYREVYVQKDSQLIMDY